jgi:uncharacterized protein
MTKLLIDYKTLEKDTLLLVRKIKKYISKDTQVVCISRGGLFIGGLLSYALDMRDIHCVSIESYKSDALNDNQGIRSRTPFLPNIDKTKTYLFVDDLNDTSQTFSFIKDKCEQLGISFYFATVYHKLRDNNMMPNFIGRDIASDCWVVFPWDLLESEDGEA